MAAASRNLDSRVGSEVRSCHTDSFAESEQLSCLSGHPCFDTVVRSALIRGGAPIGAARRFEPSTGWLQTRAHVPALRSGPSGRRFAGSHVGGIDRARIAGDPRGASGARCARHAAAERGRRAADGEDRRGICRIDVLVGQRRITGVMTISPASCVANGGNSSYRDARIRDVQLSPDRRMLAVTLTVQPRTLEWGDPVDVTIVVDAN